MGLAIGVGVGGFARGVDVAIGATFGVAVSVALGIGVETGASGVDAAGSVGGGVEASASSPPNWQPKSTVAAAMIKIAVGGLIGISVLHAFTMARIRDSAFKRIRPRQ